MTYNDEVYLLKNFGSEDMGGSPSRNDLQSNFEFFLCRIQDSEVRNLLEGSR